MWLVSGDYLRTLETKKEQMMSDFNEDDAAMAVVLNDKVRELIRKHIYEAFNDPEFMAYLPKDYLHEQLQARAYGGIGFAQAVRDVIKHQMNKI